MATQVQRRRGTASEHNTFTGAAGEVTVNTTNDSLHVHDGATAGGIELSRADGQNANMPTSAMPAGSIVQVVQSVESNSFQKSVSANTYFEITVALRASITPTSSNNKILVQVMLGAVDLDSDAFAFQTRRNNTPVGVGNDAADRSHTGSNSGIGRNSDHANDTITSIFLDSPNTTSALEYRVYGMSQGDTFYFNRNEGGGTNTTYAGTTLSTVTLFEVVG